MILNEIVQSKHKEIEASKRHLSLDEIVHRAKKAKEPKRSFYRTLANPKLHLICELKKASPSEGVIRKHFNPLLLAKEFETAGASAISVLTETRYFLGDPKTIKKIRTVTSIPLLRKDFIVDPYQIYETAILGADAFLIIAMLVPDARLKKMIRIGKELGLDALVEVHTEQELNRAIRAGSQIIGINNRNLKTLKIDLKVSERLLKKIPKGIISIVESGIENRKDILNFKRLGARHFLIGTTLMRSSNVRKKIKELLGT